MAKPLKDILAGVKASKKRPGSTGSDPGVDYAPKSKGDQDFVAKHDTEEHDDRVGNDKEVYSASKIKHSMVGSKEDHGHTPQPKDKKVYEAKEVHTEDCGCDECSSGKKKMLLDKKKDVKEDAEEIDEISQEMKLRYLNASHKLMFPKPAKGTVDKKMDPRKAYNRAAGQIRATNPKQARDMELYQYQDDRRKRERAKQVKEAVAEAIKNAEEN